LKNHQAKYKTVLVHSASAHACKRM